MIHEIKSVILQKSSGVNKNNNIKLNAMANSQDYNKPSGKKFPLKIVLIIIGAILGSIIAWLCRDRPDTNPPALYGPPPVDTIGTYDTLDTTETVVPADNE